MTKIMDYTNAERTSKIKIITLSQTGQSELIPMRARSIHVGSGPWMGHSGTRCLCRPLEAIHERCATILMVRKDGSFLKNRHMWFGKNCIREDIRDKIVVPAHESTAKKSVDMPAKGKRVFRPMGTDTWTAGTMKIE